MTKQEILKLQFVSLREEIKESKVRMHKTLLFGLTVAPAASIFGQIKQVEVLLLLIPLFIVIIALLYQSDGHAVMRCGTYIKNYIESEISDFTGWEEWLFENGQLKNRAVDILLLSSFYLLFFIYYVTATFIASSTAKNFGPTAHAVVTGGYSAIGVVCAVFLAMNFRSSTQTRSGLVRSNRLSRADEINLKS
jgi:hypothetical protein